MLSCIIGNKIVNTFEKDSDFFRKLSKKGLLKCRQCGNELIYCNGNYKIPYFKHKELNEECDENIYNGGKYDSKTLKEHNLGIKFIYNELLNIKGIEELQLEKTIKETNQRADIYFKYNNKEYVIEFQCTPIQNNYVERHYLYKTCNINDIWIIGSDKFYKIIENKERKFKVIEKEILNDYGYIISLDVNSGNIKLINSDYIDLVFRDKNYKCEMSLINTFFINKIELLSIEDIINLNINFIENNLNLYLITNLKLKGDSFIKYRENKNELVGINSGAVININDINSNIKDICEIESKRKLISTKLKSKWFENIKNNIEKELNEYNIEFKQDNIYDPIIKLIINRKDSNSCIENNRSIKLNIFDECILDDIDNFIKTTNIMNKLNKIIHDINSIMGKYRPYYKCYKSGSRVLYKNNINKNEYLISDYNYKDILKSESEYFDFKLKIIKLIDYLRGYYFYKMYIGINSYDIYLDEQIINIKYVTRDIFIKIIDEFNINVSCSYIDLNKNYIIKNKEEITQCILPNVFRKIKYNI